MLLIVIKRKDTSEYTTSQGIMCAMRTLCKITGKKMYENELIFACKVPDKEGDETLISKFYQHFPSLIPLSQYIYDENKAADYWEGLGGNKNNMGYGLVTRICRQNNVKFVLIPDKEIN